VGVDDFALLVEREDPSRVGQGMDDDGRVLASFDDFVQIADASVSNREGERSVVPGRACGIEEVTPDEVGRGHVLVAGKRDQRAPELPCHELDKPRLAATGGPLQDHRHAMRIGVFVQLDLVSGRAIEGLRLDPVVVHVRRQVAGSR